MGFDKLSQNGKGSGRDKCAMPRPYPFAQNGPTYQPFALSLSKGSEWQA